MPPVLPHSFDIVLTADKVSVRRADCSKRVLAIFPVEHGDVSEAAALAYIFVEAMSLGERTKA